MGERFELVDRIGVGKEVRQRHQSMAERLVAGAKSSSAEGLTLLL